MQKPRINLRTASVHHLFSFFLFFSCVNNMLCNKTTPDARGWHVQYKTTRHTAHCWYILLLKFPLETRGTWRRIKQHHLLRLDGDDDPDDDPNGKWHDAVDFCCDWGGACSEQRAAFHIHHKTFSKKKFKLAAKIIFFFFLQEKKLSSRHTHSNNTHTYTHTLTQRY